MWVDRGLFGFGTLDQVGGLVQRATWDLTRRPSWRADLDWTITEVGWIPAAAATDAALFQFSAGAWRSDTIALPTPGGGNTFLAVSYPLPSGWDGQLGWEPGGFGYAFGVDTAADWPSASDVSVWVQLRARERVRVGGGSCA